MAPPTEERTRFDVIAELLLEALGDDDENEEEEPALEKVA